MMEEPLRFVEMPESERYRVDSDAEEDQCVTGTASPPACDKWSISIEDLLADPAGLEVFEAYLSRAGKASLLSFWLACKIYRDACQPGHRLRQAQGIYKQYLSRSAVQHVKIGEASMKAIRSALAERAVSGDAFVTAQIDVVNEMRDAEYPAFLKSSIYRDYVDKVSRRRLMRHERIDEEDDVLSPPFEENATAVSEGSFALSATDVSASMNEDGSTLSALRRVLTAQQNAPKPKDDQANDGLLHQNDLPDAPPVPRAPRKYNYRPDELFLLLRNRLEEVILYNEPPACLRPDPHEPQLLGNIVEQPELDFDPDFDVGGLNSSGTASKPPKQKSMTATDDLLSSCAASLVQAMRLTETEAERRHRAAVAARSTTNKTHVHHHEHVHHHHYDSAALAQTATVPTAAALPFAVHSDQRSIASSDTGATESLYMAYDRTVPYPSRASSVASYNSREGSDIMTRQPVVYNCANRDMNYLSPPSERKARNGRMHSRPQRSGIEISYKLILPSKEPKQFRFRVNRTTVTLKDFKAYLSGKYRYYFLVYDPIDKQKIYQEYTKDSEFLPVYDGKIEARVQLA